MLGLWLLPRAGLAAPAGKALGLPVLCHHGCLKSHSLRREATGAHSWRHGCVKKAC